MGRKKPYTERGINRIPCTGCGKPSAQQWQICCLGNEWHGVCNACDYRMNAMVLSVLSYPNRSNILDRYYGEKLKGK